MTCVTREGKESLKKIFKKDILKISFIIQNQEHYYPVWLLCYGGRNGRNPDPIMWLSLLLLFSY